VFLLRVSTAFLSSPKLPLLLQIFVTKKRKQLVYFDHQNVNSLCLQHHYVFSTACASSVFLLSFSINLLASYHECYSLIGYATHYRGVCEEDLDKDKSPTTF